MAAGLMIIIAVGLMIGLTGFQQYAVESSRSMASTVLCAPNRPILAPGQTVTFSIAELPTETTLHWSAPEGQSSVDASGRFTVIYNQRGTKTVSAFFRIGDSWERTSCTVEVQ